MHLLDHLVSEPAPSGTRRRRVAEGVEDLATLQSRWSLLLARQAGLRVRFSNHDGAFQFQIQDVRELPIAVAHVHRVPAFLPDVEVDPFGEAPIRLEALVDDGGWWRAELVFHHVVADEHSVEIIRAGLAGEPASDIDDAVFYAIVRQARAVAKAQEGSARSGPLAALDASTWKTQREAASRGGHANVLQTPRMVIPVPIADVARGLRVSVTAVATAAAVAASVRRSAAGPQVVGLPFSLRDEFGFDSVGPFVNVVPVIVAAPPGCTIAELVENAHNAILDGHDVKHVPLWRIPEALGRPRGDVHFSPASALEYTVATHAHGTDGPRDRTMQSLETQSATVHVDVSVGVDTVIDIYEHSVDSPGMKRGGLGAELAGALPAILALLASDPDAELPSMDDRLDQPRVDATDESAVAALISQLAGEILGRPVAAQEDFFDVGFDSLSVARLVGRSAEYGVRVRLRDLYSYPTPYRLASRVALWANSKETNS
ncbi:phosphopantetheine-binding protein [Clavibacter michiganensis]|nr:phosphopantetheine-binding protein [Clavibacter michiganensis]